MKTNVTYGRYNEPGANGKDIYGQTEKVKEQIKKVKKTVKKEYIDVVPVPAKDDFMNPPFEV